MGLMLGSLTGSSSYDEVAQVIISEAERRGHNPVPPLSTAIQESSLRPQIVSTNGAWVGLYQQDTSYLDRGNPNANISQFFDRLDTKCRTTGSSSDLWLNIFWLQQRPGEKSADTAYRNGRQAYLTEIKSRTDEAQRLVALYGKGAVLYNRPDFNEYPNWTTNFQSRGGTTIDGFFLHSQEGEGNADSLGRYIRLTETYPPDKKVSYHYTASVNLADGGVTVVDCVDTDYASWSVGNANNRSINLCFAGSRASWTREEWLRHSRVIDVAAYLAVQDCQKYGIRPLVIPPPYTDRLPGISDHNYVTRIIGWGSHTDVGSNFPWDVFTEAVAKYSDQTSTEGPTPVEQPPPAKKAFPKDFSDRELLEYIAEQLGPGHPSWASKGATLRDKVWSL